jgi:hypothetical protein
MTARFWAEGLGVYDRKDGVVVCVDARTHEWAEMIADGLNMIVEQVAPWSPSVAHSPVVDGEVVDDATSDTYPVELLQRGRRYGLGRGLLP